MKAYLSIAINLDTTKSTYAKSFSPLMQNTEEVIDESLDSATSMRDCRKRIVFKSRERMQKIIQVLHLKLVKN